MGVVAHHAIVVTGGYQDWAELAHACALKYFPEGQVSPLSAKAINGYQSFCVFPDGSKEGWSDSAEGDAHRDGFIAWLKAQAYSDGSSPLAWAEVNYGEIRWAKYGAEITRSAWSTPVQGTEEST